MIDKLNVASTEALICLKARAFIDLTARKENGENIDNKNIKKHKNDIVRLTFILPTNRTVELPDEIAKDLKAVIEELKNTPPDLKVIAKNIGVGTITQKQFFTQKETTFNLGKLNH